MLNSAHTLGPVLGPGVPWADDCRLLVHLLSMLGRWFSENCRSFILPNFLRFFSGTPSTLLLSTITTSLETKPGLEGSSWCTRPPQHPSSGWQVVGTRGRAALKQANVYSRDMAREGERNQIGAAAPQHAQKWACENKYTGKRRSSSSRQGFRRQLHPGRGSGDPGEAA